MGKSHLISAKLRSLKTLAKDCAVWDEQRCLICGVPHRGRAKNSPSTLESLTMNAYERYIADALCTGCRDTLRQAPCSYCSLCGHLMPFMHDEPVRCGECLREAPPWNTLTLLGEHTGLLRDLVVKAKFSSDMALFVLLGKMLAHSLPDGLDLNIDMIVPLPLHPHRLRERGFNQCIELGNACALVLKRPVAAHALERVVNTKHQIGLGDDARRGNVRGAFVGHDSAVRGSHVFLLDDTMTTGATLRQATEALKKVGAASVHVGVITRAQRL